MSWNPPLAMRCIILKYVASGVMQVWYAGLEELGDVNETTGLNILEQFPEPMRSVVAAEVDLHLFQPCGWITEYRSEPPGGGDIRVRSLNLPLADMEDKPGFVLTFTEVRTVGEGAGSAGNFLDHVTEHSFVAFDIGAGMPDVATAPGPDNA